MSIRARMRRLLERREYPIGTRRKWKSGEVIKVAPGKWEPVSKDAPPAGTHATYIGEPKGERWNLERWVPPKAISEPLRTDRVNPLWGALNKLFEVQHREDDQAPEAQLTGRFVLRSVVGAAGLVSRDLHNRRLYNRLGLNSDPACVAGWGFHHANGVIELSPDIAKGTMEFISHYARNRSGNFAAGGPTYTPRELRGMKTAIHEEIHGCSILDSMKSGSQYRGAGAAFEEATTELAARKIMKDAFSLSQWDYDALIRHPMNPADRAGSYHEEISALRDGISAAMMDFGIEPPPFTWAAERRWWTDFLGTACAKMREDDGRPLTVDTLEAAYRRLATKLPIPEEAFAHVAKAKGKDLWTTRLMFYDQVMTVLKKQMSLFTPPDLDLTALKRELQAEAKKPNMNPYSLKRNDLEGAIRVAKALKAAKRLTPESVQVLVGLQDDHKPLTRALNAILK